MKKFCVFFAVSAILTFALSVFSCSQENRIERALRGYSDEDIRKTFEGLSTVTQSSVLFQDILAGKFTPGSIPKRNFTDLNSLIKLEYYRRFDQDTYYDEYLKWLYKDKQSLFLTQLSLVIFALFITFVMYGIDDIAASLHRKDSKSKH